MKFAYRELIRKQNVRYLRDAESRAANYSPAMSDEDLFLGGQLKKWRKAQGLTLEQLAADIETSKGYLSEMERNIRPLNTKWLAKVANFYHVKIAEIVGVPLDEGDDDDLEDMFSLVRKLKRQGKIDKVRSHLRFLEAEGESPGSPSAAAASVERPTPKESR